MKTMLYHKKKIFFVPLAIIAFALFSWITMLLWNVLMPAIFGITAITFWQAAGVIILARLIFGFGHHRSWGYRSSPYVNHDLREKIKAMTPEEKKEFFRKMHYNRQAWHHEHCGENNTKTNEKE